MLYLAETQEGVVRELNNGSGPLWIQKFMLPTDTLQIADFRVDNVEDLVNHVFWLTEHAGEAGAHPGFEFSQRVASIVALKFDGMLVPGVRGNKSHRYANIVVFGRISDWKSWLHPKSMPTEHESL